MYGRSIGSLNVYLKPEGIGIKTLIENADVFRKFEKSFNQGNTWHMGFFYLNSTGENFQVLKNLVI